MLLTGIGILLVGLARGEVIDNLSFDYHGRAAVGLSLEFTPLWAAAGDAKSHVEMGVSGMPELSSGVALSRLTPSSAGALWSVGAHDVSEIAVVIDLHAAWQPKSGEGAGEAMMGDRPASFGFFIATNTAWVNKGDTMLAGMNGEYQGIALKLEMRAKTKATITIETRVPGDPVKTEKQSCTADFTKADTSENPSHWQKHLHGFPVRVKLMINHG
jgi:hypothetical protein